MGADVKAIMRTWEDMKGLRLPRESEWQQIADYFMPRKDFGVTARPNELVRRRVASGLGPRILGRGAALLVAYLIDPAMPFIGPNVDRSLMQAGRPSDIDAEGRDYLSRLEWLMYDTMMAPRSGYMSAMSRVAVELMGFGNGVKWIGRNRGVGPRYQARPFRSCWFVENEDGEVDTLYFRWTLPAWRVVQRYPEAAKVEKIAKKAADEKTSCEHITLLHVVEPRESGKSGAVATNKPFKSVVLAVDEQAVLEESGYDSFPYAVARLDIEEGSVYGTGRAWQALPDVMAYNFFQQALEKNVALRNDPPMFKPGRMFAKPWDGRPGAINNYDPAALGFQKATEALQRVNIAGDPMVTAQHLESLKRDVEEVFFVDWMSLNDGVQKTATEIMERRDLRVRAMSALVPSIDRDLIGRGADRTLDVMVEEGLAGDPPPSVAGLEVGWDYKGPLAMMQMRGQYEAVQRLFALTAEAAKFDPGASSVLMVSEGIRAAAEALGVPLGILRSREEVEALQAQAAEAQDEARGLDEVQQGATAMRDAGQGLSSLMGAGPGGGQGGRPPMPEAA